MAYKWQDRFGFTSGVWCRIDFVKASSSIWIISDWDQYGHGMQGFVIATTLLTILKQRSNLMQARKVWMKSDECLKWDKRRTWPTSLKLSKASRMILCPPLTRQTAAKSSSPKVLVLSTNHIKISTSELKQIRSPCTVSAINRVP